MTTTQPRYSKEEFARRGEEIYQSQKILEVLRWATRKCSGYSESVLFTVQSRSISSIITFQENR